MRTRGNVITLLTDFGLSDHYVAAMKGVMLDIFPQARLIDITHEITPFAIAEGAYTLAQSWRYFPKGTVYLVVIDPGVGSARRAIIAEAGGHYFVAPDNGVLTMALDAVPRRTVREITASRYFRHPVSRTFHGRDIFAPVAAHLAKGEPPARFGRRIDHWVSLELCRSAFKESGIVLKVDRFGNVITSFDWNIWNWVAKEAFELHAGRHAISLFATNYAEMKQGELYIISGSGGYLEISLNQGSAAQLLGLSAGAPIELRRLSGKKR